MSNVKNNHILVRELGKTDLDNGFFESLSNLSDVSRIDQGEALQLLNLIRSNPYHEIFVAVLGDGSVVGSITILIEKKFIHSCGRVGHIEDVVTRKGYEGRGIGSALVRKALEFATTHNCYKVILDCSEGNVAFYENSGFRRYGVSMRFDLSTDEILIV